MAALSASALYEILINPQEEITPEDLLRRFSCSSIEIRLSGLGALAKVPNVLAKVRGAMGQVMLEGASDAVRQQKQCDWVPCCASEVFFAEKPVVPVGLKGQSLQIIKPFVLSMERSGSQDLLIKMGVFGLAQDWAPMAMQALVSALRERVDWSLLAGGLYYIPKTIQIAGTNMRSRVIEPEEPPSSCLLSFLEPVDSERANLAERPELLFEKIAVRIALASRWFGAKLDCDLVQIVEAAKALELIVEGDVQTDMVRIDSGRSGQSGFKAVSQFDLNIEGEMAALWPFLRLGEVIHAGRAAVRGYGLYRLIRPD